MFPQDLLDKITFSFLNKQYEIKDSIPSVSHEENISYFKLPFIGKFSGTTKRKLDNLFQRFCKNSKIKLVFTTLGAS